MKKTILPITDIEFQNLSGQEMWGRFSSCIGHSTGHHYGAPDTAGSDRTELARLIFESYPLEVSLLELMQKGHAQYQARRTEINKDLKPFGLRIDLSRTETGANGRKHTWYILAQVPAVEPAPVHKCPLCGSKTEKAIDFGESAPVVHTKPPQPSFFKPTAQDALDSQRPGESIERLAIRTGFTVQALRDASGQGSFEELTDMLKELTASGCRPSYGPAGKYEH